MAIQTCEFWFTLTVVCVDPINAGSTVLALVTWAVVNVVVAVFTGKT